MAPDGGFVELVRIGDTIQADLFIAYLGDAEIEFIVQGRESAGMMSHLMPRAQKPVIISVHEDDLEHATELLAEYRAMQAGPLLPSEAPPPAGDAAPDEPDEG